MWVSKDGKVTKHLKCEWLWCIRVSAFVTLIEADSLFAHFQGRRSFFNVSFLMNSLLTIPACLFSIKSFCRLRKFLHNTVYNNIDTWRYFIFKQSSLPLQCWKAKNWWNIFMLLFFFLSLENSRNVSVVISLVQLLRIFLDQNV